MAGRGPAPKDSSKRVRRNADVIPLRIVDAQPAQRPELPEFDVTIAVDGEVFTQVFEWPEATRRWWDALALHPLAHEFTEVDWQFLVDTARIHAEFWNGAIKLGAELRLREAKYGFTPEDRLRLRLSFAQTDEAEDRVRRRREMMGQVSRERRGGFTG